MIFCPRFFCLSASIAVQRMKRFVQQRSWRLKGAYGTFSALASKTRYESRNFFAWIRMNLSQLFWLHICGVQNCNIKRVMGAAESRQRKRSPKILKSFQLVFVSVMTSSASCGIQTGPRTSVCTYALDAIKDAGRWQYNCTGLLFPDPGVTSSAVLLEEHLRAQECVENACAP